MDLPIFFISDIHLMLDDSEEERQRQRKLYRFMNYVRTTRGTLFFVGDLFDFYFEYPDMVPKAYFEFYNKAFQLKKAGVDLRFIVGNHDYWLMDFMKKKIMNKTYFGDTTFSVNGKNFYITHGDGILSWDWGYRLLKLIIRSPFFIWCFRWIHPTISYKIGRRISRSGRHPAHSNESKTDIRNELKQAALNQFDKGFDYMISGHYHLGEMIQIKQGKLVVLGDWIHNPTYAMFDGNDLSMHSWGDDA